MAAEYNTPMGRFRMAQKGVSAQGKVLTVPDEGERRPPLSSEEAQRIYSETFAEELPPPQQQSQKPYNRQPEPESVPIQQRSPEGFRGMPMRRSQALERISPEAKRRIQVLAGLGKISDDYDFMGTKYTFRSLSTLEGQNIFAELFDGPRDQITVSYKIRISTLSHALTHIDDQPAELVLGSEDLEIKRYLFEELGEEVTEHMWKWYQENIVSVTKGKLSKENAKELAEDVKK